MGATHSRRKGAQAEKCQKGHSNWTRTTTGKRRCITCKQAHDLKHEAERRERKVTTGNRNIGTDDPTDWADNRGTEPLTLHGDEFGTYGFTADEIMAARNADTAVPVIRHQDVRGQL